MNVLGINLSAFSISLWFINYILLLKKEKLLLSKGHHSASILRKKILFRIRLLDMNIYHMILNSGDNNYSYCIA